MARPNASRSESPNSPCAPIVQAAPLHAVAQTQAVGQAEPLTHDEVRAAAETWFSRQVESLKRRHGQRWADNEEWILSYLRGQLRGRLLEIGWRPKR